METLLANQWHLTRIQLVNWGTFCGYHDFALAKGDGGTADVVMITGESGTGKSTLFDAKTAVMMRSNARFNSASNQTTGRARGMQERNLYSYVMGKQDDEYDPTTGETKGSFLRSADTANWSAVSLTFKSDTGEVFGACRLYYVGAHQQGTPDTWCVTADADLDPRAMEAHATKKFSRPSLRAAFPNAKVHDGPESFLRHVYATLSIGAEDGDGDGAMKLHERIQAGTTITNVDALFKDLVIDEPSTYRLAEEACDSFRRHEAAWVQMDDARRKMNDLAGIREIYAEFTRLGNELGLLESLDVGGDGPLALWICRRRSQVLLGFADEADLAVSALDDEIARRNAQVADEQNILDALRAETLKLGGGEIERIEHRLKDAQERLEEIDEARRRLGAFLADVGRTLPEDAEAFEGLVAEAQRFLDGYDELIRQNDERRVSEGVREHSLAEQERSLSEQLSFYLAHPVNITKRMADDRMRIARATGIPEGDLPYAAELMDLEEGEDRWRVAANVGFHGLASLLLVDRQRLDELSIGINALHLDHRIAFHGVRLRPFQQPRGRLGMLSSKIIFKENSPFTAWMADWIHDSQHDYICVDGPEELGGRGQRITVEGQTRQRSRGAHGHSQSSLIIGFSNEARVAEVRGQLAATRDELTACRRSIGQLAAEARAAARRRDSAMHVCSTRWEAVDVVGAQERVERLQGDLDRLRQDSSLMQLIERRDEKARLVSDLTQELGATKVRRDEQATMAAAARTASREATDGAQALDAKGIALTPEQESAIGPYGEIAERPYREDNGSLKLLAQRFDTVGDTIVSRVRDRMRIARGLETREREALEAIFKDYHKDWLGDDVSIGITAESYDDYLRILEALEADQLDLHIDDWLEDTLRHAGNVLSPLARAYTTDLREIRRRMTPINDIMSGFSFGPDHGHLEIAVSERPPRDIQDFRRELNRWSGLATQEHTSEDAELLHQQLRAFMNKLEEAQTHRRVSVLNTKRLVYITVIARYPDRPELPDKAYSTLGAKSGGETQELIAFILGAALLFCLGDNGQALPTYAPVFLDEAFVKADERFTRRAVKALVGLGFQVIIAVPTSKVQAVEPVANQYVCITKDPATNHSYIVPMTGVRKDD